MRIEDLAKAIHATDRVVANGRELAARAMAIHEYLGADQFDSVPFGAEMIRENLRSIEFWLTKLEEVVEK